MQPEDRVFLEPIGYIGYFSGARLLDYPGLVSPAVVDARREFDLGFYELIDHLHPEWIVLRPHEYQNFENRCTTKNDYEVATVFDARDDLRELGSLPGIGYLYSDATFFVLKRRT